MKAKSYFRVLGAIAVLTVVVLLAGCVRSATNDVLPTQAAQDAGDDVGATAAANSTLAAAQQQEPAATLPPTVVPVATAIPPTEEPPAVEPTPVPPLEMITPVPTTSAPPPAAATTAAPPSSPSGGTTSGGTTHTVQAGENLFRIALRYGTTVNAVAAANGIANPAQIYVGQRLIIPGGGSGVTPPATGGTTYVVQPGDNLFRIALRYNMSYVYLAQYNNISNPANIRVGQVIRIP